MKLLILSAYFYPEKTSSLHLNIDRFKYYAEKNVDMEMFVPFPTRGVDGKTKKEYRLKKIEKMYDGKLTVHRFSMYDEGEGTLGRFIRYFICNIIQFVKGLRTKGIDMVYCDSTPPTQGIAAALISKIRHIPFVYNLQDVFPDSLVNAGMTRKGSVIWKTGRAVENFTYKHADRIVVISEDIKKNILDKGVDESKIELIPNWTDTDGIRPVAKDENKLYCEFGIDPDKFTVVYAGNMGAAQGADIIISAAKELKNIQFAVFGGGAEYSAFKERAEKDELENVIVNPLLPSERVAEVYSVGDVALITCKKGTGIAGMPSKTWSIMSCNTPIVASFDVDSELADILKRSKTGICVPPQDVRSLVRVLDELSGNPKELEKYRNGREYVTENASKDICTQKNLSVLEDAYCGA